MKPKILFVDDEENILESFKLSLRKFFQVETALGPGEGLRRIVQDGPFPVVVSDLKMPRMDGIQFLSRVKELAPSTVRIMLTGHADLDAAIAAVNEGEIFRFLTKPCPADLTVRTLKEAVRLYSLEMAEKELLRGTLRGSIKVLTDILAMVNPEAFGRSERVRRLAIYVGQQLSLKSPLFLDLAAMLCQLGCVTLPQEIITKVYNGKELTPQEQAQYETHPAVTAAMLQQIPRLEKVSEIILHQQDRLDQTPNLPIEARILKICLDYDSLMQLGLDKKDAIDALRSRQGWYDEDVLNVLERGTAGEDGFLRREVGIGELKPGMILVDALWSLDEVHIMAKGTEITEMGLLRLENFARSKRLPSTIRVLVPLQG